MPWLRSLPFFVAVAQLTPASGAALPAEVTLTQPTRLEIVSQGKPTGSVALPIGEKLELVGRTGEHLAVRYRNLNGRVPAAHTNLPAPAAPPAPHADPVASPAPEPAPASPPATVAAPRRAPAETTALPATAASKVERLLAGKLVALEGGGLRPLAAARLAGVRFFGLYFSASWCPPCRSFTPELVDAYGKIRALYPEFEIVLISRDRSPADMLAYLRDDRMPWPALAWSAIREAREINRYAGSGIPCLVLINEEGKVLSDSYRWGRYVGPDAVVTDTWKILRDYRRQHPHTARN
jgi:nucleoredoxin